MMNHHHYNAFIHLSCSLYTEGLQSHQPPPWKNDNICDYNQCHDDDPDEDNDHDICDAGIGDYGHPDEDDDHDYL